MVMMKSARKMKNKTFAIDAAPSAMPPKPKMAAMIAMMKNITDQRNISFVFSLVNGKTYGSSTCRFERNCAFMSFHSNLHTNVKDSASRR